MALISKEFGVKNVRRIVKPAKMALHVISASDKLSLIRRLKAVFHIFHRAQKARTSKEMGVNCVRRIANLAKMALLATSAPDKLPLIGKRKPASYNAKRALTPTL